MFRGAAVQKPKYRIHANLTKCIESCLQASLLQIVFMTTPPEPSIVIVAQISRTRVDFVEAMFSLKVNFQEIEILLRPIFTAVVV